MYIILNYIYVYYYAHIYIYQTRNKSNTVKPEKEHKRTRFLRLLAVWYFRSLGHFILLREQPESTKAPKSRVDIAGCGRPNNSPSNLGPLPNLVVFIESTRNHTLNWRGVNYGKLT
jgi:hypothetical protein